MKKTLFTYILFLFTSICLNAQAIRKSYLEMTTSEKTALVNAFYQLRDMDGDGAADSNPDDDDLITDLANFHSDFFNFDTSSDPTQLDIHYNLPDEPTREIFFAWHRAAVFELEQKMQDINPNISMPFWDSTQVDNYDNPTVVTSVNSTLFSSDFLGPFDSDWGLNRNVGGQPNSLPTTSDYPGIVNQTDFFTFSNRFERRAPHTGAHRWVGGAMPTSASPRDPVFYLHHTFVDKSWNAWEKVNQSSAYIRTSMIRYDGTYTFHGETLPLINPNDIIDSKVYGTFYAENQLAELENYTVSNTYNTQENFYYQYTIQVGDNFIVPNTKNCKIESVNEIVLTPGFTAENGSDFVAKIDIDNDVSTLSRGGTESRKGIYNPFTYHESIIYNAYEIDKNSLNSSTILINYFPNPFKNIIHIKLSKTIENCKIEIYNTLGKSIKKEVYKNAKNIDLTNLNYLSSGIYFLKVTNTDNQKQIITNRLIKL